MPAYSPALTLADVDAADKWSAEESLRDFVRQAWPIVEPAAEFIPGWHVDAICEYLQAVSEGHLRHIVINIPPRCAKSLLTSVFWPAWDWLRDPWRKWLCASYAIGLSRRDAVRTRRLIMSPWYQSRWGDRFELTSDQNEKTRYENNHSGFRIATSVGGSATGEGGDIRLVDDPHKASDAQSDTIRASDIDWWRETWSNRVTDPKRAAEVVIMQRLHERDLTGHILAEVGGYEHLMLPMRYEPDRKCVIDLGGGRRWEDPRAVEGELLWPARYGEPEVMREDRNLGSYGAAGQLQQRPAPSGGGIFKHWWLRFWWPRGLPSPTPERVRTDKGEIVECVQAELPEALDHQALSWDCAFKGASTSDYVVGQAWGQAGANHYLLDQIRERLDMPATVAAIRSMASAHPKATEKLIEDKANGPAVVSTLQDEIPGLIAVTPEGGKIVRAHGCAPRVEAGNVWLPHPSVFPWVRALIDELVAFPNGANDDQVDSLTQYLNRRPEQDVYVSILDD